MNIVEALQSAESVFYYIREHQWQEIAREVSNALSLPLSDLLDHPMGGYRKGGLPGSYRFVLQDLCGHVEDYLWLYDRLSDAVSKYVLWKILCYRLVPNMCYIASACERIYKQYYDPEIIACKKDEVFVDCGGFIGDSAQAFIDEYHEYKKIYVFEPSQENLTLCRENLAPYPDIEIIPAGVSNRSGRTEFSNNAKSSRIVMGGAGNQQIPLACLDEAISEPVSFIKMDIEGAEAEALEGAEEHIRNDRPKLAICVYHLVSDLWALPRIVDEMLDGCAFYLRHYQADRPWETVFYAIPCEHLPKQETADERGSDGRPNICMIPAAPLQNVQILKDRIVIPYVYYQHFGRKFTIVTKKTEDYPYMKYLEGAAIDPISYADSEEKGYEDAICYYLLHHYKEMDLLFLFGLYPQYAPVASLYKMLRPDGKIYMKMDANSSWMDRIPIDHPLYVGLMASCDVISCEAKRLQHLLSRKWQWRIDYIPNGYHDFFSIHDGEVSYSMKENTILTVGRIGTQQKNNELLLEAFAKVSDRLAGWTVRLVGNVEPEFRKWFNRYLRRYPRLKSRIVLTGAITEKQELFQEYKKAKIFALTSRMEGGAPNVYSEAISCGCVPVVTAIDASDDMTDGGRLGMVVPQEDSDALASVFLTLCKDEERLRESSREVQRYLHEHFDYERIIERLDLLIRLS